MPRCPRQRAPRRRAAVLAAVLLPFALAPRAVRAQSRYTTYLPYAAQTVDLAAPPRDWGVQFALEHYPELHDATVAHDLTRARAAGMGTVRTFVRWDEIEAENLAPEDFDWRVTDARLSAYRAAGFELIVGIVGYPEWAMVYGCGYDHRTGMAGEWRAFVRALAQRYGGPDWQVVLWEIGNEVDGRTTVRASDFDPIRRPPGHGPGQPTAPIGGCWGDRAAAFLRFYRGAWREIRLLDPLARITFGGLAYAPFEDNFVPGFLDDFLALGGGELIDVLSVHWFGGVGYYEPTGIARLEALRATMARHGVDVPVWLTEVHRMTRHDDRESELWPVPWLTQDLIEVLAEPSVERVIWYGWRDFPAPVVAGVGSPWQRGMLREDGADKLALPVLASVIRATAGRPAPLALAGGDRVDAESAARAMTAADAPYAVVDGGSDGIFAATFERPRSGEAHVAAFVRDGHRAVAWLAVPPGWRVTVLRFPLGAVRAGDAPVVERPAVRGGVVELALDGETTLVRLTIR